jgi:hypothetical protein
VTFKERFESVRTAAADLEEQLGDDSLFAGQQCWCDAKRKPSGLNPCSVPLLETRTCWRINVQYFLAALIQYLDTFYVSVIDSPKQISWLR